jgi:hypothetical protein
MGMSYEDLERALVRQGTVNAAQRAEIDQLRADLAGARQTLWLAVSASHGVRVLRRAQEDYPGNDIAVLKWHDDPTTGDIFLEAARVSEQSPQPEAK